VKHLTIAIAALAVAFAAFGVATAGIWLAFLLPAAFARPGRRLAVAAWMVVIGPPALLVAAHYFAWGVICYYEGRRPVFISDPFIENVHNTPILRASLMAIGVAWSGILSSPFVSIPIAWVRALRTWKQDPGWRRAFWPTFSLPAVWFISYHLLVFGPREVSDWFID
jgi:hypothetical protein